MSREYAAETLISVSEDFQGYEVYEVASAVMKNNQTDLEEALQRLNGRPFTVKIQKFQTYVPTEHSFHEITPVTLIIDSGNWTLLPVLARFGYDPNLPQCSCLWGSRYSLCNGDVCLKWVGKKFEYASALAYFFDYVFKSVWEHGPSYLWHRRPYYQNQQYLLLGKLDKLLTQGLDVNTMDSVKVFSQLGCSLTYILFSSYREDDPYFPEFPNAVEPHLHELNAINSLFKHGFSNTGCLHGVDPETNWLGIAIQLLAHPGINKFSRRNLMEPLPELLRTAARLLLNFLLSRHQLHPDGSKFRNFASKVTNFLKFSRHNPTVAHRQMDRLMDECMSLLKSPPALTVLARNRIRECLGGKDFQKKVTALELPRHLGDFVISIGPEHIKSICAQQPYLISMASGHLKPSLIIDVSDLEDEGEIANAPRPPLTYGFLESCIASLQVR